MRVVVVGAGIIGATVAAELSQAGAEVHLLEANGEIGDGCSRASAGLVAPHHVRPLASLENVSAAAQLLLGRKNSPFTLQPTRTSASWMLKAVSNVTATRESRFRDLLRFLALESWEEFSKWERSQVFSNIVKTGVVSITEGTRESRAFIGRKRNDSRSALDQSLPPVVERFPAANRASFNESAYRIDPYRLVKSLVGIMEENSGTIRTGVRVAGVRQGGSQLVVETNEGGITSDRVIIAAGTGSRTLTEPLGLDTPIVNGVGYAIDYTNNMGLETPCVVKSKKIAISPYRDKIRVSGLLDLGLPDRFVRKRADSLQAAAEQCLPDLAHEDVLARRHGARPCSPDGLPIIGSSESCPDLLFATGHGMWGIALAPVTALLIANELGLNKRSASMLRLEYLRAIVSPDRFSR